MTWLLLGCLSSWSNLDGDGDGASFLDGDCNDRDPTIGPGAVEIWYDGIDQDCDGASDYDADRDGYESAAYGGTDCDDARASDHPDAEEHWYDGRDQDCAWDDDFDADGDGFPVPEDCDDQDFGVNPSASETWYDGVDQDCDGSSDFDVDGDGWLSVDYGGRDCKDSDPAVHPGATDQWYDCEDSDCDGNDGDQDGDGYVPQDYACDWTLFRAHVGDGDCWDDPTAVPADFVALNGLPQPTAAQVHPDAEDPPYDGVDGDCAGRDQEFDDDDDGHDSASTPDRAGLVGDDCDDQDPSISSLTWYSDSDGDGFGDAASSLAVCTPPSQAWVQDASDCDDGDSATSPDGVERCGGEDEDCDGTVDESTAVDAGTWYDDADGDGFGDPSSSQQACQQPADTSAVPGDCDDGDASVNPDAQEICDPNDVDEDCNGLADDADRAHGTDAWYEDHDGDGYGDGSVTYELCDPHSSMVQDAGDCDDGDTAINPGVAESCSTDDDDDCDDVVNEGCYSGGELIVSEVQHDPSGSEPEGQFLELYNTTGQDIYADGLRVKAASGAFTIAPGGLVVPATGYAVLCFDDSVLGSTCDVVYGADVNGSSQAGNTWDSAIDLASFDTVTLSLDGTVLDSVSWEDGSAGWPSSSEGSSLELGAAWLDASSNDAGPSWCIATSTYASGERGTPGQPASCTP